ncbi:hypothetical protein LY78DRAFT_643035 [Colletotrichum sublineola]|nr:hypothetical protein LY78DRAFT_643035 [Colletotrichum sublineola]
MPPPLPPRPVSPATRYPRPLPPPALHAPYQQPAQYLQASQDAEQHTPKLGGNEVPSSLPPSHSTIHHGYDPGHCPRQPRYGATGPPAQHQCAAQESQPYQASAPVFVPIPSHRGLPVSDQREQTPKIHQITSQLGRVSIRDSPPRAQEKRRSEETALFRWKRALPIPVVSEEGKPNDTLWDCPESRVIDYETDWYHMPEIPNFTICTCCYEMYLSNTPLSASLERVRRPRGACGFQPHRVTRVLIPQYLKTLDPQPLRDYMAKRLGIQDCHGVGGVKGSAGVKWFRPLDTRLNGFLSCEACYEEVILGTAFHRNWAPYEKPQAKDDLWACDVCIPFIGRILINYSVGHTWEDWIQATIKHMNLPICDKEKAVAASSRKWVRLSGGRVPDMKFCERCYEEHLACTPLAHEFELIPSTPGSEGLEWMQEAPSQRTQDFERRVCSAANNVPLLVAVSSAIDRKDIDVMIRAAKVIVTNVPCTGRGIAGGTWYTLAGGDVVDGFKICPACHAAWVSPWNLDRFYEVASGVDAAQTFLCSLHPSAPRWTQQVRRWQEALEVGVWSRYSNWVRTFAGVPPCAGDGQVENRKWHGWEDCPICAECWVAFCRDARPTASGLAMEYNGRLVPGARMCCMYSPRMRQKWTEACEAGDAGELVRFSRTRLRMYAQTVVQIRRLRTVHEMQVLESVNAGRQSLTWLSIQNLYVSSGITDGYQHGNSTLGWHPTVEGARSAAYMRDMSSLGGQSWSTLLQIEHLQNQWRHFE